MRGLSLFQKISLLVGLGIAGWLLVAGVSDAVWANRPLVRAFFQFDQLRDKARLDADGLFSDPAFDELRQLSLNDARRRLERASFSCETPDMSKSVTSCHYGYETDTGCCRFRVELSYAPDGQVMRARGDKIGQCGR